MWQRQLPFVVSIPHGGAETPPELDVVSKITAEDLFDDSDAFTREIYSCTHRVAAVAEARIARAFIDLNRPVEEVPPDYPDGIVKMHTCMKRPIYRKGRYPEGSLLDQLIELYYRPYHAALAEATGRSGIVLGLDCHSMLAHAPPIADNPGSMRPLFNLGIRGGASCPVGVASLLKECICKNFETAPEDVTIDVPFKGGYITRLYGRRRLPWIQIEMNRSFYLADPWFDREKLQTAPERLADLNGRFISVLMDFASRIRKV